MINKNCFFYFLCLIFCSFNANAIGKNSVGFHFNRLGDSNFLEISERYNFYKEISFEFDIGKRLMESNGKIFPYNVDGIILSPSFICRHEISSNLGDIYLIGQSGFDYYKQSANSTPYLTFLLGGGLGNQITPSVSFEIMYKMNEKIIGNKSIGNGLDASINYSFG